ncbi:LacI family transcriptional regulator [Lentibacillus lipolyticus]|nr:LacI family transcriptional regulator [Lentibacillus lipolyticus]
MATIRDVAKLADVSTATVSRVINRNGYVNAETKRRVTEAIEQLNYVPNDVARSLFKGRSKMIALFVPDITNPFFPELARAVEDVANQRDYTFVLCNTDNDPVKESAYLNALQQKSADGFVIVSSSISEEQLEEINVPMVAVDRITGRSISSVTVNNYSGSRQAVQHLKSIGCKRIAHISGPEHTDNAVLRLRGYLDEVMYEDWFNSNYIAVGEYNFDTAREAAIELLRDCPEVDGVFAGNDLMGAGVLNAAAALGRRVPDDLSVIGFDGISIGKTLTPTLTTMVQPIYEIGAKAADMVITQIENGAPAITSEELPVQLMERQSSRRKE